MERKLNHIGLKKLLPLCRLLVDDLKVSPQFQRTIIESLIHWWITSTDETILADVKGAILLLADSSLSGRMAQDLADAIDITDPLLTNRTLRMLQRFSGPRDASLTILVRILSIESGGRRWWAASELAELGMTDEWILTHFSSETASTVIVREPSLPPTRVFDLNEYRALYDAALNGASASQKGSALEDLSEYIFLCIPGLNCLARNLRTLAEEIDLAFSNNGAGFWREIGDPFIIECKNLQKAVEAKMIRDFRMKLQTKGLRAGFVVTTNRLTRDATIELRQSLADGRTIVAVEREHLEAIANGAELGQVLADRFYVCRLL